MLDKQSERNCNRYNRQKKLSNNVVRHVGIQIFAYLFGVKTCKTAKNMSNELDVDFSTILPSTKRLSLVHE